jgi:hypothetical protein
MRSSHPRSPIDHPSNGSKSQIFGELRSLFLYYYFFLFLVLQAKHGSGLFFGDDGDTTSPSLEPRTPETSSSRVHSDPDDSDDDDFWM